MKLLIKNYILKELSETARVYASPTSAGYVVFKVQQVVTKKFLWFSWEQWKTVYTHEPYYHSLSIERFERLTPEEILNYYTRAIDNFVKWKLAWRSKDADSFENT